MNRGPSNKTDHGCSYAAIDDWSDNLKTDLLIKCYNLCLEHVMVCIAAKPRQHHSGVKDTKSVWNVM